MNRRFLTYIIASIAAVGLVIAAIPFIQSWRPSETAAANRVVLELDEFAPATYQVIAGRNARLYILHFPLGTYRAFKVPVEDGRVRMPDIHWWRRGRLYNCVDFGPDDPSQPLTNHSLFRCHDSATPEWWATRWKWRLDGSNVAYDNGYIDPLDSVTVLHSGSKLQLYGWDIY